MSETLNLTTSTETIFWICAIVGSIFFLIKILLLVLGGFDAELDASDAADAIDGADAPDAGSSDVAFKTLSLTSVAGFLMMFGWTGLACFKQYELGGFASLVSAIIAGTAFMYLIAYLFHVAFKLVDEGDTFNLKDTIGKTANVYQKIPNQGNGKIQLSINGIMREIAAVSEAEEEIESFAQVTITRIVDPNTVSVTPITQ